MTPERPSPPGLSRRQCLWAGLALTSGSLWAQTPALAWRESVAGLNTRGTHHFRYWGLSIYHAELQVAPGFEAARFVQHRLALTMRYSRAFTGSALTESSLKEMQGIAERNARGWNAAQGAAWQQQLGALMPDVNSGDRLSAVNLPGRGVALFLNQAPLGSLNDPVFAEGFLGVWLSPQTPQPAMRLALLAT